MGRLSTAVLAACVACGSPSQQPAEDAPGPYGGGLVEGPNPVTVRLFDPVDYIRYRNGTSGWGEPERVSELEYRLHVDDAYEVIVACEEVYMEVTYVDSELHARALADGDDWFFGCYALSDPPPVGLVTVSGTMQQAGRVHLDTIAASKTAPWTFTMEVRPGVHDLVAVDTTGRIAVRRDLDLTTATTIAPIDLDQEGTLLTTRVIGLFGLADSESVTTSTTYQTARETAWLDGTATELALVPPSLLAPDDRQWLSITAATDETDRDVSGPVETGQTLFQLMPHLGRNALTFTVPDNRSLRGELTAVPTFDELELAIYGDHQIQRTLLTTAFRTAAQRSYIAFDTPLDFMARWRVDLRSQYARFMYARQRLGDYTYSTSRFDLVTNVLGN